MILILPVRDRAEHTPLASARAYRQGDPTHLASAGGERSLELGRNDPGNARPRHNANAHPRARMARSDLPSSNPAPNFPLR